MKNPVENHYDNTYFNNYQKKIGEFGGEANRFKFQKHINPNDTVLDFGCGGGFLLKNINAKQKIGIELNPVAREFCNEKLNIKCFEDIEAVEDGSIDIIISNHCLEHTTNPTKIIEAMYRKLKKGGKIVIVVPLDSSRYRWKPNDINNHLYSFSPMNLGNILQSNNFKGIKVKILLHKWPPFYLIINKIFGRRIFHVICYLYGQLNKKWVQTIGIAIKS